MYYKVVVTKPEGNKTSNGFALLKKMLRNMLESILGLMIESN